MCYGNSYIFYKEIIGLGKDLYWIGCFISFENIEDYFLRGGWVVSIFGFVLLREFLIFVFMFVVLFSYK